MTTKKRTFWRYAYLCIMILGVIASAIGIFISGTLARRAAYLVFFIMTLRETVRILTHKEEF